MNLNLNNIKKILFKKKDYSKIKLYNEELREKEDLSDIQIKNFITSFKDNYKLKCKDYIITLLGYTNTVTKHTNWFPWNRFKDVFLTIGYKCEWVDFKKLMRKDEKRIFITWNEPTSLELYKSGKVEEYDIIFQKLTSLGKGLEKENWTSDAKEWCKNWNWPIYQTFEYLYDLGVNIYAFGCKTKYDEFPEKKRICEKLKDRIFWISWGGTPYNWQDILSCKPIMDDLNNDICFIGSKWGKVGRGNIDAWQKYLTPLEKLGMKHYGGIGNKYVTDEEMVKIYKKNKLCPIIHAPSWQAESGIQDRFYSVFLSGRFGICDNFGAIDIIGEEIREICEEDPKKYYEKSLYFLNNVVEQRKYIEIIQKKIKSKYNFYTQWHDILCNINVEKNIQNINYTRFINSPIINNPRKNDMVYRYILTSCNNLFFSSLLLLIYSLYKTNFMTFYSIIVYDIGLSEKNKEILNNINRVKIISFNINIDNEYISNYIFKVDMMYLTKYFVDTNLNKTMFLYIDSGIYIGKNISKIWNIINDKGYFSLNMNYKEVWGKSAKCIKIFNHIDNNHVNYFNIDYNIACKDIFLAGIFGFKLNSEFSEKVIDAGFRLSKTRKDLFIGDKFKKLNNTENFFQGLSKYIKKNNIEICNKNFIGYRHDMTIYNILAYQNDFSPSDSKNIIEDITSSGTSEKNYKTYKGEESSIQKNIINEISEKYMFTIHRNIIRIEKDINELRNNLFPNENTYIKNLLKNKKCVIVGPSKDIYEKENGNLIDTYDFVVRVNKHRKNKEFFKNIGSRCDILIHCLSETPNCGGPVSDVDMCKNIVMAAYPLLDDFKIEHSFITKYGNIRNYMEFFRKYKNKYKLYIPDTEEYIELEKDINSRPNAGFMGIINLLNCDVKELWITGFTFFKGGYHESYRKQDENYVMNHMKEKGFHNQEEQLKYFVEKIVINPVVKIDNILINIINKYILENKKNVNILGNGPSLKTIELKTLRNMLNVSYNRAYIVYEERNFYPTYYFCIDKAVLLNCLNDIIKLIDSPIQKIILLDCDETRKIISDKIELVSKNDNNGKYFGDVAVYSIYYLTCKNYKIFNIYGCDCNYIEDYESLNVDVEYNPEDKARRIVLKPKEGSVDLNHFIDNYFGEGTEYSVPRTENHLNCWKSIIKTKIELNFKTKSKVEKYLKNN